MNAPAGVVKFLSHNRGLHYLDLSKTNNVVILFVTSGCTNKLVDDDAHPVTNHEYISDDEVVSPKSEKSDDKLDDHVASNEKESYNGKHESEECDQESVIESDDNYDDYATSKWLHAFPTTQAIPMVRKNF